MPVEGLEVERCDVGILEEDDLARFVGEVLSCCPRIRSIWRVGDMANREAGLVSFFRWDLIAFADVAALERLRISAGLHRADVRLRVVTDGDLFETAWGAAQWLGSLAGWEWHQTGAGEAFYNETATSAGRYARTRHRAVRVWHAIGQVAFAVSPVRFGAR